jgi:replicative DNA helicase
MKDYSKNVTFTERKAIASKDAETNCLALCLKNRDAINDISGILTPDDFNWQEHIYIYSVILDLYNEGKHVDPVTVSDELTKRGQIEAVSGSTYINNLYDIALDPAQAEEYATRVRDWSVLRKIKDSNEQINSRIIAGESVNPNEIIDFQTKGLFEVSDRITKGGFVTTGDMYSSTMSLIEHALKTKQDYTGIKTGFLDLDRMTSGFQPGEYIVVAARTSVGKTAFANQIATHVAVRERLPVAIFELEMTKEELMLRMLSNETQINSDLIRRGYLDNRQYELVKSKMNDLKNSPIFIDDTPGSTMMEIKAKAKKLKQQVGDLGLIVIDYIGLIKPAKSKDSSYSEVGDISTDIKNFAKEMQVPVMVLAQLNRAGESREDKTPVMANIADSDRIPRDADTVILLHRPSYYNKKEDFNQNLAGSNRSIKSAELVGLGDNSVQVIIEKKRNGPTGIVHLNFIPSCAKFTNKI